MTKAFVFGASKKNESRKKIEFLYYLHEYKGAMEVCNVQSDTPSIWDNVMLLSRASGRREYDIIFAWNKNLNEGTLYLGHWNDGIV